METEVGEALGADIYCRILATIKRSGDRSVLSEELARSISDAESDLAFSRQRHCLLRPILFPSGEKALELGGGYGALARYLGEIGLEVKSIEEDANSAEIARLRCRDLPNVDIVQTNTLMMQDCGAYDWFVLTDDVPLHGRRARTLQELRQQLAAAEHVLASTGTLVYAAENRLGLKYLLGAKAMGSQQPFEALNSTRSFGDGPFDLATILSELETAGFVDSQVLLPFPDHVFPKAILTATAAGASGVSVSNALWGMHGRDYRDEWYALVDEHRLWGSLQSAGIAAAVAHSFLIVAKKTTQAAMTVEDADAWRYTVGNRYSQLTKSIAVSRPDGGGRRTVRTSHLLPLADPPRLVLRSGFSGRQIVEGGVFFEGQTEAVRIAEFFRGGDSEVISAFGRWAAFLRQQSQCSASGDPSMMRSWTLSGTCVEKIPQNLIWPDEGDTPFVFDNEPQLDQAVPLVWVLYRGILQCMRYHDPVRILRGVADDLSLTVVDEDVELAQRLESEMMDAFYFTTGLMRPDPIDFPRVQIAHAELEQELAASNARLEALLSRKAVRVALRLARAMRGPVRWWRSISR